MSTKITVGGVEYDVPKMKFRAIDEAAPLLDEMNAMRTTMQAAGTTAGKMADATGSAKTALKVVAIALAQTPNAPTFEELYASMEFNEVGGIVRGMSGILQETGLAVASGEAPRPAPEAQ